ncbi:unnamed protein product [Prorocentrum cordatum]|uniref:Stress-response A/B barrel domain-containing protein n=1 Tax=Prorocentrum cordatum TaxID=2364126 RepID=A0ABN9SFG8_9DINO|nr:unnamed protein product [Polarella glacialis]CAK0860229.1 unnamed protein product [Polarella glacialis]
MSMSVDPVVKDVRHIVMARFKKDLGSHDVSKIKGALADVQRNVKELKTWHCSFATDIGRAGEFRSTHSIVYQADFENHRDFTNAVHSQPFNDLRKMMEEYVDPSSVVRLQCDVAR